MPYANITIDSQNAAFGETPEESRAEILRIIREALDKIEREPVDDVCRALREANGNRVGHINILPENEGDDE